MRRKTTNVAKNRQCGGFWEIFGRFLGIFKTTNLFSFLWLFSLTKPNNSANHELQKFKNHQYGGFPGFENSLFAK